MAWTQGDYIEEKLEFIEKKVDKILEKLEK